MGWEDARSLEEDKKTIPWSSKIHIHLFTDRLELHSIVIQIKPMPDF